MKIKVFITSVSLFVILFLNANKCSSQKLSISVLGGYNIAPYGSVIGQEYGSNYYKNVTGSYGEGISYGIGVGYKICTHVALNVDVSMLYGKKLTVTQVNDVNQVGGIVTDVNQANVVRLNPGFIFTCNEEKKIQPFAKAELVVGVFNRDIDDSNNGITLAEIKNTGGFDLGFEAALGTYFKLSKHLFLLADINGISENHGYTNGMTTKDTYMGNNELSALTTSQKQFIYKDEIDYTSQTSSNPNSPSVQIKQYYPFSSLGVEVGIKYAF